MLLTGASGFRFRVQGCLPFLPTSRAKFPEFRKGFRDYIRAILGYYWGSVGILEKKMETAI